MDLEGEKKIPEGESYIHFRQSEIQSKFKSQYPNNSHVPSFPVFPSKRTLINAQHAADGARIASIATAIMVINHSFFPGTPKNCYFLPNHVKINGDRR